MTTISPVEAPIQAESRAGRSGSAWFPAALAAAIALALYAVTLNGTYVYDDQQIVLRDARVLDPASWRQIWTKDYFNGGVDNLYRPLVTLSYALQWQLHGDVPWAFHLVNWLLHAGVSAGVAELARRLSGGNARVALIAGCLFAAHPIHVEVVANIVGRAESMCALAMLGAMLLFLHRPMTVPRAIIIAGCAIVAMLCKEQGLLLPLLLLALHFVRKRFVSPRDDAASHHAASERNAMLLLVLVLCWSIATVVYLRENVLGLKFWWERSFLDPTQNPLTLAGTRDRWLMPLALLGRYTQLLIAPITLSPDYGGVTLGHIARWNDPYLWAGIATVVTWIIAMIAALIRRHAAAAFCLLGLAVTYSLVGNAVTIIGTIFGERLMYLPSAFFLILIALAIARARWRFLAPVLVVVLSAASLRTITYAQRWNDPVVLYWTTLRCYPGSIRIYFVLSEELVRHGQLEQAADVLAKGRAVMPNYAVAWYRSALVSLRRGRFEEAHAFARRAQSIDPLVTESSVWKHIRDRRVLTGD